MSNYTNLSNYCDYSDNDDEYELESDDMEVI